MEQWRKSRRTPAVRREASRRMSTLKNYSKSFMTMSRNRRRSSGNNNRTWI